MRLHEAMFFLWWKAFEEYCINEEIDLNLFSTISEKISELGESLGVDRTQAMERVSQMLECFADLKQLTDKFNLTRSEFKTHQLWLKYIGMIETLMCFIHAKRDGVWSQHLLTAADMSKVIAAADHQKYVHALVAYLEEMMSLPDTAPEVHSEFLKGHFTIKRSAGYFNGIWTDMALECSQNCDAKGRSGQTGLIGLTLKPETQEKWFTTLPFAAAVSSAMKTMTHMDQPDIVHHEDNQATRMREKDQRQSIISIINSEMINPFTYSDSKSMMNIETGLQANDKISHDLSNISGKGHEALTAYIETGKYVKVNLKTFADMDKTQKGDKKKKAKAEMSSELQVLKRALIDRNSRNDSDDNSLEGLLKYELRTYPPALAETDAVTQKIYLRSGNKSSLVDVLEKKTNTENCTVTVKHSGLKTAVIIDVMYFIRINPPTHEEESELYAKRLLRHILTMYPDQDIHLAADRYDGLYGIEVDDQANVNLKDASGCRQRRNEGGKEYEITKGLKLRNFDQLLRNKASKANLLAFLFHIWSENVDIMNSGSKMYLSGGFKNRLHMHMVSSESVEISEDDKRLLSSTHEEADTRIFLHAVVATKGGCKRIIICASDTDIVVIALYLYMSLLAIGLRDLFVKSKSQYIPIHTIAERLSKSERDMLPLLHALSGCDTNSFVFGKGKRMFLKAAMETGKSLELAELCNEMKGLVTDETIAKTVTVATDLLTHLYARGEFDTLNAVRTHMYSGGSMSLESIAPTDDAFKQHVLRAIFQTHIWITSDEPVPRNLNPFQFGWAYKSGTTRPVLMLMSHAPTQLNRDNYCKCKKKCVRNCLCKKMKVRCELSCVCRGRANTCVRSQFDLEMN